MKKGQVVELENGKIYAIAEVINLNGKDYYYTVNIENNNDICFSVLKDNKIYFVDDKELYRLLLIEVAKKNINQEEQ